MKLFNVTRRVVDLVWADTPEEATASFAQELSKHGFEVLPDGDRAFVSEPVESMGWAGEG